MAANDVSSVIRLAVPVTGIIVDVDLRRFVLYSEVMRVLALLAFLADAGLKVRAEDGLGVFSFLESLLLNKGNTLEERAKQHLLLGLLLLLLLCLVFLVDALLFTTTRTTTIHDLVLHLLHIPIR